MLVDEGKFKWDDRAAPYLPGMAAGRPVGDTRESPSATWWRTASGSIEPTYIWSGTEFTREDILRRQRYIGTTASFRLKFGYNNHMFLAVGHR